MCIRDRSDAAFFLNFLNNNTQGKLTNKQLFQVANEIGSDCPFFLENKKKYVTGTGNILNEIKIDIKNKFILIVDPEEPINTTEAYNNVIPNKPKYDLRDVLFNENIENWSKYCLLYTSPSPRDKRQSRMPSSA